jgi:hypothetical protein
MANIESALLRQPQLSAHRILRQAREAVGKSPHFRGERFKLQLETDNGVLTVQGRLPSYFLKQMLQTVLRDIEGVHRIENCVDVISSERQ